MSKPLVLIAFCAGLLSLGACDKAPTTPPTPMVSKPVQGESGAVPGTVVHQSVPATESVLSPTAITPARTDGTRSPSQESTGPTLPGQNNDHSAPLAPAKRASAP